MTSQPPILLLSRLSSYPHIGCAAALPSISRAAITRRSEWIEDLPFSPLLPRRARASHQREERLPLLYPEERAVDKRSQGGGRRSTVATSYALGDANWFQWLGPALHRRKNRKRGGRKGRKTRSWPARCVHSSRY
ncbi:uncharacterized protein LOC119345303 [Triticum dicoccoides]|uniref:uncharacterized protein LOC119345303 n=1 Tax=Triticum dicoccoides TaxID=85692 RepID=UPI001890A40D|nr:uncharacterized protein LOC119345303 [Triticum dicoccoides]